METTFIKLEKNNISDVYRFIYGPNSIQLTCRMAEDRWDDYEHIVEADGMKIIKENKKTQVAMIGDYVINNKTGIYVCSPDLFNAVKDLVKFVN